MHLYYELTLPIFFQFDTGKACFFLSKRPNSIIYLQCFYIYVYNVNPYLMNVQITLKIPS